MDTFLLQILFLVAWPFILGAVVTWLTWGALRQPWVFLFLSCVALYLVYALANFLFGPTSVGFAVSVRQPGEPAVEPESFVFLRPYFGALLAFTLAAIPTLAGLLRLFRRRRENRS